MKTNATLFTRPITSTNAIVENQFRVNDDRVLFKVEKELMNNPTWIDIYNCKEPVDLFLGITAPIIEGDKFLSPTCANADLSNKIFIYKERTPDTNNIITVESEDGKKYHTAKTLFNGALKIIARNDEIPFITNGKINITQDIYHEDGGECIIDSIDNKLALERCQSLIPKNNEYKSYDREALLLLQGRECKLEGEQVSIDKCYLYNAKKVSVRGERGIAVYVDFFDGMDRNILTLRVTNNVSYLMVSNYENDPCFNVITKK